MMRPVTIILVVAALGIAGLTAFLAKRFLSSKTAAVQAQVVVATPQQVQTSQILVAGRDLAAGTVLRDSDMRWQSWPNEAIDRRFVVRAGSSDEARQVFTGAIVRQAFLAGEPIVAGRVFRQESAGFMAGVLTPGMVAMSVSVTTTTGVGGFVLPGDRVDVILAAEIKVDERESRNSPVHRYTSETVLRNRRVLAIDQKADDLATMAATAKTVTIELTSKEAEILAISAMMGTVTLALRSLMPGGAEDEEKSFTSDLAVNTALGNLKRPTERSFPSFPDTARTRPRPQPAPEPRPPARRSDAADDDEAAERSGPSQIKIYRGTSLSRESVPASR
jgi:pilus assembly protein CpaB